MRSRLSRVAIALLLVLGTVVGARLDSTRVIAQSGSVRLALVNVPDELLRPLLPAFQMQTSIRAEIVYTGNDPFAVARDGKADLVIAHYGHEGVQSFVSAPNCGDEIPLCREQQRGREILRGDILERS